MKTNNITIGSILSTFCVILISFNPVIGVQAVENELQEEIQYITIPSEYYPFLKDFLIKMVVDEIVIDDLDFWSYEGEDGLEYIPIICELVQIMQVLSVVLSAIFFVPFILLYMFLYGGSGIGYFITLGSLALSLFFLELRDKLLELEENVC